MTRSVLWKPSSSPETESVEALYDVFITQKALAEVLRHVWDAGKGEQPFGLLAGDLCEDEDGGGKYVLISGACQSPVSLSSDPAQLIPAEAWQGLPKNAERLQGNLVGWYLRSLGEEVRLSDEQLATHLKFFSEPWHSAIVVAGDIKHAQGGFFRQTSSGFPQAPGLPFHEIVATDSLDGGEMRTVINWSNVDTSTDVQRGSYKDVESGSGRGRAANERPTGPAGAFAEEISRRAILAAASETAAALSEQRDLAEAAVREAEEDAVRKAAELEEARLAAEAAAKAATDEAARIAEEESIRLAAEEEARLAAE
ncbi:MAG: hypothetical protein ABFS14_13515, partial [Gemmatimonadota bacterium]